MNIPHTIINVSLNVAFVACFIGFFFFTYAKNIEKQIVVNNIEYLVNDLLANTVTILPDAIKSPLSKSIKNTQLPDLWEADKEVKKSNNNLLQTTIMMLGILLACCLYGANYMSEKHDIDFEDAVNRNLILLVCIGLTKFIFLKFIAQNFISADPHVVVNHFLELLRI
jgi:hypothetical protein